MRKRYPLIQILLAILLIGMLAVPASAENLLKNGSFQQLDSNGMPSGWSTGAYYEQSGYSVFNASAEQPQDGERCIKITNIAENDARFQQTVRVEPETTYCLSGWIRTDEMDDAGHGANLSVQGVYVFSDGVWASDDWTFVQLYGETGIEQTEVTVFARVGGYSGLTAGAAWFDNLTLERADNIPDAAVVPLWTNEPRDWDDWTDDDGFDDVTDTDPYWPGLLAIGVVYALITMAIAAWLCEHQSRMVPELKKEKSGMPLFLILGMVVSAVLHFWTAQLVDGYQVDINCFSAWGSTMARVGAGEFYTATGFCDYPPAYVYILGLNSVIANALHQLFAGHAAWQQLFRETVVFKFIPGLCDILLGLLVYRLAREQKLERNRAGVLGLLVMLNPVSMLNSAAWGQMDSVLLLLLALVAWLAINHRWGLLMPVYMLAVLVKPQALMLGFLGLTAIIVEWIRHPKVRREMLFGVLAAFAVALVVLIPFCLKNGLEWVFELYGSTLSSYPYVTVNTANLYYLFDLNWMTIEARAEWQPAVILSLISALWGAYLLIRQKEAKLRWTETIVHWCFAASFILICVMGGSYAVLGAAAMAWAFAVVLPMYVRGGKPENLPLLGALLFLLLYVLGVKMHERYLFPAIVFLIMAFTIQRDRRLLWILALVSFTMFVNEGIVLDNSVRLGSAYGHLNYDTVFQAKALAVVNLFAVLMMLHCAWEGCCDSISDHSFIVSRIPVWQASNRKTAADPEPDARLHWQRIDTILVLGITLIYSVLCLTTLGSTKAPQNAWVSSSPNETVTIDLGQHINDFNLVYFARVSYNDFTVSVSDDLENWSQESWCQMNEGLCYHWIYASDYSTSGDTRYYYSGKKAFSGRYVRICAQQIGLVLNEILFRDADLHTLPARVIDRQNGYPESPNYSDPQALLDEQDTLEGGPMWPFTHMADEPGWYNSAYFDEIYHARTAYEYLRGTSPYETTHPPLGKLMMTLSVLIFGMTPFGWRFAGALMGILMLPAMYLFAKQLTKKTWPAVLAMLLMTLDCMHFAQTRIATIDSFPVFFIILSWFFMLRFMQRDMVLSPMKKLLPDLALCGFFFGCSVASKWIGCYSGAGLAVVFFWQCIRQFRRAGEQFSMEELSGMTREQVERLQTRREKTIRRVLTVCLWCVLFFVVIPVVIYLLSYLRHLASRRIDNLPDYIMAVIRSGEGMLSYHSTPGLGMDHPFYSPWYEWPVNTRPMYYAMAQFMPEGYSMSIFCFGNPAVFNGCMIGTMALMLYWCWKHWYSLAGATPRMHLRAATDDCSAAFLLIGLMAQFLPWVLVPRGTYIYHYFASVPFIILASVMMLYVLQKHFPRISKGIAGLWLMVCLVMFVVLFPYASGLTVPKAWLELGKHMLTLYFS